MVGNSTCDEKLALLAAGLVVLLFSLFLAAYYVPAFDGVDENGYLCTAQRMVLHGTTVKQTAHPLEYVSDNVVQTGENVFYAKYPLGYPWLAAAAYWLGGPDAVFLVNPILAVLAVIGIFFLTRSMIDSFAGIMAMILLATNPWHAMFGLTADSHTGAMAFSVWGMYFLWRWGTDGGRRNAILAGGFIAYAYTVRYTEALLIFPVVAMITWRGRTLPREMLSRWRLETGLLLSASFVTVLPLLVHHWVAFGAPWRTGYGLCGESTGFGWTWFRTNWWLMLTRLNGTGLILIFPMGLAGLAYVAAHDRCRAWFLGLWAVPPILLYASYYWAPENEGPIYARFFMTVFVPLIVAALVGMCQAMKPRPLWTVAVGVFVALAATWSLREAITVVSDQTDGFQPIRLMGEMVQRYVPDGSILVADADPLNSLEYRGRYEMYSFQTFDRNSLNWRVGFAKPGVVDDNLPHALQLRKAKYLESTVGRLNNRQLADLQRSLLASNIAAGRSVYVVTSVPGIHNVQGQFGEAFHYQFLTEWYQVTYTKVGVMQLWIQMLYRLDPPGQGSSPREGSLEDINARIDRLQFQVMAMREEMNDRFAGEQQLWAQINRDTSTLQMLRDKVRQLSAQKPK